MSRPISSTESRRLFELQDSSNVFELIIRRLYESILKRGDRAIDGGAHGALHTVPMAEAVGPAGLVFAFEPIPHICDWLRTIVAKYPQVIVHQRALSDHYGRADFHLVVDEPWLSSIGPRKLGGTHTVETIKVELTTLDQVPVPVRFIKLDLEGSEYHAVKGGARLLARGKPTMALECGRLHAAQQGGYSTDDYFALFDSLGYELFDLFGRPFGRHEFARPWNDRSVPHYIIATIDKAVSNLLNKITRDVLSSTP